MGNLAGFGIYKIGGSGGGGGTGGIYGGSGTVPTSTTATLTDSLIFEGGVVYIQRAGATDTFTQLRRGTSLKITDLLVSGGGARTMRDSGGSDFYNVSQNGLKLDRSASIGHFTVPTATLDIVGDGSTNATTSLLVKNSSADELFKVLDDGTIGVSTSTPDASALLDLSSTSKGFLQPRMTGAEIEAISSPATGLQAYATSAGAGDVTGAGWWGYDGTNWVEGFSSSGGSSIYTADGTIGSGRVATVTDTIQFQSVSGAAYGGFILKPALVGAGANEYATISYGADTILSKYRANQAYAFGKLSDTTNNFDFNTGANPNFSSVSTIYINGGSNTNALHIMGAGATSATYSILVENGTAIEPFTLTDAAECKIANSVASPLNALTLENQANGSTHADCGVKLQLTSNAETGFIAIYDSTSGGSNAPTMEIVSPLGLNYEAGAAYAGWHHRFKTDNAVVFGVTNSGTNGILTSVIGGGGGTYSEFQMAYTGGDYNFIKSQHNTGGKFIFGRENGGTTEYMRIAQDGEVLIGTPTTDSSAILNVASTTQGFLPPRMTTAEMNAISTPATGLMVYDTTTNQWMGYNGTSWVIIG